MVQSLPIFRISRPKIPGDNIGFHRDTWYGASAFEMSVVLPFTDFVPGTGFYFLPGSHIKAESHYGFDHKESETVTKGDKRHLSGIPYAPKTLDPKFHKDLVEVEVNRGQFLIFNLAVIHGSMMNTTEFTRFSIDNRLAPACAPVDFARKVKGKPFYVPFVQSPLMQVGTVYAENNVRGTSCDNLP